MASVSVSARGAGRHGGGGMAVSSRHVGDVGPLLSALAQARRS
jgi:hypothetical protein